MAVMFIGMPLGRRGCIMMGDACVIVGSALQASAMSVPHIIVGRIICVSRVQLENESLQLTVAGFRYWLHLFDSADLYGRDEYRNERAWSRSSRPVCVAYQRYCSRLLDRLWLCSGKQPVLLGQ